MILGHASIAPGDGHREGRRLLQSLYHTHMGDPMPPIQTTRQGKPYFEDHPVHFSITHTKQHVFCALSQRPIGIDAEAQDRSIDLKLADKILSPAEKARWEACPDKRLCLLRLWVLKEAYAKATGRGWGSYLYETDFDPNDPRIQTVHDCLLAIIEC